MKDMLQLRHWIAHLRNQDDEWSVQHKPYKASNVLEKPERSNNLFFLSFLRNPLQENTFEFIEAVI